MSYLLKYLSSFISLNIAKAQMHQLTNLKKYLNIPLYRNSIAIILNSVFASLFGLVFWIVAARMIPSKDVGLACTIISTSGFILSISGLGMDNGLVRYFPESQNKRELYNTVSLVTLILAIFTACIFLLGINYISPAMVFLREGWYLPSFLIYVACISVFFIQNITFIALRKADISFLQNLLLGLRIPIILLLASFGVLGVLCSFEIIYLVSYMFGAYILYKNGIPLALKFDKIILGKMLNFSLGNYTANIFILIPNTIIPLMVLNFLGAEEAAYYYIAYSIASLLFIIPNAISTSLFVEGSHSLPLRENVIKSLKFAILLLIPVVILIILFGDRLLLLYSAEYSRQSYSLLQLFAISSIFSVGMSIYFSIKKIQKEVRIMNYLGFINSALLIGTGYFFINIYGLMGLGYAWLVVNIISCVFIFYLIIKKERWISIPGYIR